MRPAVVEKDGVPETWYIDAGILMIDGGAAVSDEV